MKSHEQNKPIVGIVMGSSSDGETMGPARGILVEFGIECEVRVLSAHRTPEQASAYAREAIDRGLEIIIAGAGGAAHLAGVLASLTTIPVIGVPIRSKSLDGLDSLLSIVQMPPGIPVATVGIDSALNAGLLAASILAGTHPELRQKIQEYRKKMEKKVLDSNELVAKLKF